jgi:hypothetical protein
MRKAKTIRTRRFFTLKSSCQPSSKVSTKEDQIHRKEFLRQMCSKSRKKECLPKSKALVVL